MGREPRWGSDRPDPEKAEYNRPEITGAVFGRSLEKPRHRRSHQVRSLESGRRTHVVEIIVESSLNLGWPVPGIRGTSGPKTGCHGWRPPGHASRRPRIRPGAFYAAAP